MIPLLLLPLLASGCDLSDVEETAELDSLELAVEGEDVRSLTRNVRVLTSKTRWHRGVGWHHVTYDVAGSGGSSLLFRLWNGDYKCLYSDVRVTVKQRGAGWSRLNRVGSTSWYRLASGGVLDFTAIQVSILPSAGYIECKYTADVAVQKTFVRRSLGTFDVELDRFGTALLGLAEEIAAPQPNALKLWFGGPGCRANVKLRELRSGETAEAVGKLLYQAPDRYTSHQNRLVPWPHIELLFDRYDDGSSGSAHCRVKLSGEYIEPNLPTEQ